MKINKTSQLYDQKESLVFYQTRYEQGYMDEWPKEKKVRLLEIIRDIGLQASGEALDFGCGNGVLTEVIRQALPNWKLFGTDISKKAITNAKQRYPECSFFETGDPNFRQKKFDFVFTNHVFEHVFNLIEVFDQMNGYLKPESSMLHILPCGNEGSFEYNNCMLRRDGINFEIGNRFFFEDKCHVRRLTTDEFRRLCETRNFKLEKEYYSNQFYGAIEWITTARPKFVMMFYDSSQAIDKSATLKIKMTGMYLVIITLLRWPSQTFSKYFLIKNKRFKDYVSLLPCILFLLFSYPVDRYWKRKSIEEWNEKKHFRNGSEMALYFKRGC